jgi:hypothetical protein
MFTTVARRHGENKGKAKSAFTEVAEGTEGAAVAAGSSDSERQRNIHHRDAETRRKTKARQNPSSRKWRRPRRVRLSQCVFGFRASKECSPRRHGDTERTKARQNPSSRRWRRPRRVRLSQCVFGFGAPEECSSRRHGDTEKNKDKAKSEFAELAEATEGSAVAVGSSDSERQKNAHHGGTETWRKGKARQNPSSRRWRMPRS